MQFAGALFVVVLHVLAIWIISLNIAPRIAPIKMGELHLVLAPMPSQVKPEEPLPVELAPVIEQPPEIAVQSETTGIALDAVSPADVLAPRPDPAHPNQAPSFPTAEKKPGELQPVLLNVLVMEDGSIAMAKVTKSSGDTSVDDDVVAYVKANWHFLPALLKQKTAVQYWTSVVVRFAG